MLTAVCCFTPILVAGIPAGQGLIGQVGTGACHLLAFSPLPASPSCHSCPCREPSRSQGLLGQARLGGSSGSTGWVALGKLTPLNVVPKAVCSLLSLCPVYSFPCPILKRAAKQFLFLRYNVCRNNQLKFPLSCFIILGVGYKETSLHGFIILGVGYKETSLCVKPLHYTHIHTHSGNGHVLF